MVGGKIRFYLYRIILLDHVTYRLGYWVPSWPHELFAQISERPLVITPEVKSSLSLSSRVNQQLEPTFSSETTRCSASSISLSSQGNIWWQYSVKLVTHSTLPLLPPLTRPNRHHFPRCRRSGHNEANSCNSDFMARNSRRKIRSFRHCPQLSSPFYFVDTTTRACTRHGIHCVCVTVCVPSSSFHKSRTPPTRNTMLGALVIALGHCVFFKSNNKLLKP